MKYTVEEVREWAIIAQAQAKLYASMKGAHERWEKLEAILTAYAERIEASEGAVPIYQRKQDGNWQDLSEDQYNRVCNCALTITRILYTHPPAQAAQVDFPACSGDPSSCPENEGYGCCKAPSHDPTGGIGLSRFQAQFDDGDEE
jgi:hypothetical protein